MDADLQQGGRRLPHPLSRSGSGRAARHAETAGGTVHGSAGILLSGRGRGPGSPVPAVGRDRRAGPAGGVLGATHYAFVALAFYFPAADADQALLYLQWGETVVPV